MYINKEQRWGMLTFLFLAHMLEARQWKCHFENARMVDATQCTCLSEPAHMVDATQCTCLSEPAHMVDATQCTCLSEPAHMVDATQCTFLLRFLQKIDRNTRGVNARLLEYVRSFQFRFNNKLWKSTGEACQER